MKKSHKWTKCVEARCPFCGVYRMHRGCPPEEDIEIFCSVCGSNCKLGKQK